MELRKEDIVRGANGYAVLVNDLSENAENAPDAVQYRVGRTQRKLEMAAKIIDKSRLKLIKSTRALFPNDPRAADVEVQEKLAEFLDETMDVDDFIRPIKLTDIRLQGCKQVARWVSLLDGPLLLDDTPPATP